jgi:hypothetical protein
MSPQKKPSVPLMELREYESANGNRYFSGFLGKAKVLMFQDRDAEPSGKELARWNVLVQEQAPRPDTEPRNRRDRPTPG